MGAYTAGPPYETIPTSGREEVLLEEATLQEVRCLEGTSRHLEGIP